MFTKKWLSNFILNIKKKLSSNSNLIIAGDFNIIQKKLMFMILKGTKMTPLENWK